MNNFKPIKINIDQFNTLSSYKDHITKLYVKDYESYIASLLKKKPSLRIPQLDALIIEAEEFKEFTISEFEYEGKKYKRFAWYKLEGANVNWVNESYERRNRILIFAEVFASATIEVINRFIQRLEHSKSDFEHNLFKIKPVQYKPSSFKYKQFSRNKLSDGYIRLEGLFDKMRFEVKLIPENANKKNFFKIFSGEPVTTPIKWIDTRISTLHCFVKALNMSSKIEETNDKHFEIACSCFIDPNGDKYSQVRLARQKRPANAVQVQNLIDLL